MWFVGCDWRNAKDVLPKRIWEKKEKKAVGVVKKAIDPEIWKHIGDSISKSYFFQETRKDKENNEVQAFQKIDEKEIWEKVETNV